MWGANGILGNQANNNSYSDSTGHSFINGFPVDLFRFGMQFNLSNNIPHDLWSLPSGSISRVWMYYDAVTTANLAYSWQGGTSYSFSNGFSASATSVWDYGDGSPLDTVFNPTHTYTTPGTYTVCTYVTGNCSSDTACTTLIICPAPALASYSYVTTYPTVDFTDASQNAASYSWDFGDGSPLDNTANPSHTYSPLGTYQVCLSVTDTCGGTHVHCKSISVCPALIPVSLGSDVTACGSTILSPQFPNATYLWNTSATTAQISTTQSGSYHVIVTDVNGCSGADTVDVVINPLPVVNLGPDLGYCGTSATLDAQNLGMTYLWSNAATTQSIAVTTNGTYSVVVTDGLGCSSSDTIEVALLTVPIANLGNDITMCQGFAPLSTQNGTGYTYLWNTGSTIGSIGVIMGGTYWVLVTASNGCTASDTVQVTMNAPAVSYVETQTLLCVNASPITLTPGIPSGGVYSGLGVTGNMFNPTTAGVGNKNVIYSFTDTAGCVGHDTSVIVVDPCSGVAELNEIGLQLYPNPSNGVFTVKFTKLVDEIIITDAIGKVIETIIPSGQQLEFDLSKKASGVYFINVTSVDKKYSLPFMIRK
ncbi:MAG: PKD domain-containing protein [Bacteroidetes bacterium]|nr:PKD domain-containing protein [Bacteroidota bacterium]